MERSATCRSSAPLRVLFVCSQNRLRSPTAEQVFADWPGIEVASAGLNDSAEVSLDGELLDWAQLVLVMEPVQRRRLSAKFGARLRGQRIGCLGIPDDYAYMQPELVALLMRKVPPYLPAR